MNAKELILAIESRMPDHRVSLSVGGGSLIVTVQSEDVGKWADIKLSEADPIRTVIAEVADGVAKMARGMIR